MLRACAFMQYGMHPPTRLIVDPLFLSLYFEESASSTPGGNLGRVMNISSREALYLLSRFSVFWSLCCLLLLHFLFKNAKMLVRIDNRFRAANIYFCKVLVREFSLFEAVTMKKQTYVFYNILM